MTSTEKTRQMIDSLVASEQYVQFLKNDRYIYVEHLSMCPVFNGREFDNTVVFNEGFAVVDNNGKSGFINREGDVAIPLIYDGASDFSEGLANVEIEDCYGFINKQGDIIVPIIYDNVGDCYDGYVQVELNQLFGIIDSDGKEIYPPISMEVVIFFEDMAHISDAAGYNHGFIDITGKIVIPKIYYSAGDFLTDLPQSNGKINGGSLIRNEY